MTKFGKSYKELKAESKKPGATDLQKEKAKVIRKLVPQRISEAEPKEIGT